MVILRCKSFPQPAESPVTVTEPLQVHMSKASSQKGMPYSSLERVIWKLTASLLMCAPMYNMKEESYERGLNFSCLFISLSGHGRIKPRTLHMPSKHPTSSCIPDSAKIFVNCLQLLLHFLKYLAHVTWIKYLLLYVTTRTYFYEQKYFTL